MKTFSFYIAAFILLFWSAFAATKEDIVYLEKAYKSKSGLMPACTPLHLKTSRGKVNLRDPNKSWPKFKLSRKDYEQLTKFSDFTTCIESVTVYDNRYENVHLTSITAGNLMPGMPSEFALMRLGPPSHPPSVTSYLDPATGQPKSYSFFVWNNHKRRNLLGSALTIAGAATGVSAAAGAIAVTQAASIATTAAAAAYSLESLKSSRVITIQVDEKNVIQTVSSH